MEFIEYNENKETQYNSAPNLDKIRDRVAQIKASEEVGVKLMQRWEEEAIIKQESKDEERISSIRKLMANLKFTAEEAMNALNISESDYDKYKAML